MHEWFTQRFGQIAGRGDDVRPVRLEQAEVDATDNERELQAGRGDDVAEGVGHALDEAVQPKTAEIVGHRTWRVAGEIPAEQMRHLRAKVAVAEAQREMTERAQSLEQASTRGSLSRRPATRRLPAPTGC